VPNPLGIDDKDLGIGEGLQSVLVKWGNETIEKLRKSLDSKTSDNTSKNLEQSLVVLPIVMNGENWTMNFQADGYWKFINSGVHGKGETRKTDSPFGDAGSVFQDKGGNSPFMFKEAKPSVKHFLGWANTKGLNPYAVRESVYQKGIAPTHFFDEVISKEWIAELVKRVEKAGAKQIEIDISKDFKARING